jgi:UDP-N-acetylmuramate dehydrogenase
MEIRKNISLKPYNTFAIDATAKYFAEFSKIDQLPELLSYQPQLPIFVLGGGSNILFTKDPDTFVLKNEIKGIEELHEDEEYIYIKAGAGENWHQFVLYCIDKGWAGIENLSLIPGHVGASPMQNIGAYGVELQQVFWSLEAFHLKEMRMQTFSNADCEFGYRESVFKNKFRNQFVILTVTFRLRKEPVYHTSYGALTQELEKMGVKELSIKAISQAVINIRTSKLPDPKKIGNAGSFFKNPAVHNEQFQKMKIKFPGIVGYNSSNELVKLAAGWLIEQCGWKGFRRGDAGCHEKQALVLVNYGNATGQEILDLSNDIIESVSQKFDITLEREVNLI